MQALPLLEKQDVFDTKVIEKCETSDLGDIV